MRVATSVFLALGVLLGGVLRAGVPAAAATGDSRSAPAAARSTAEVTLPTGTGPAGLAAFATSVAEGSDDRALDLDASGRVDPEDVLLAARRVMRADPEARGGSEDTANVLLYLRKVVITAPR